MNLPLKYRPKNFTQIVGHTLIKRFFQNSFQEKILYQAFLLVGKRGIGKTSTARIIAKCYNCKNNTQPSIHICLKCDNCLSIDNSDNVDVLEFDAASYSSVNDIRSIIESTQYNPVQSRYRIYIIDEAHMLSQSAFNALLKTLEEPPQHIIFILATTELNKIPVTISSRCQVFHLKDIEEIAFCKHLQDLCKSQNYTIDDEALKLIYQESESSMRDALSLLQQLFWLAEERHINVDLIEKATNKISITILQQILQIILNELNHEQCQNLLDDLFDKGYQAINLLEQLLQYIANCIKYPTQEFTINKLQYAWQVLLQAYEKSQQSKFSRIILNMALLQIISLENIVNPKQYLKTQYNNESSEINNTVQKNLDTNLDKEHTNSTNNLAIKNRHASKITDHNFNYQIFLKEIAESETNLYTMLQKYIQHASAIENQKIMLSFKDQYNEENEKIALSIKQKIEDYFMRNSIKLRVNIKFYDHQSHMKISQKIRNLFDIEIKK